MDAYRFNVTFDSAALIHNPITITGSVPFPVHSLQGISLITFTLVDSPGVEFASNPIQWLVNGQPDELPPWF